MCVYGGGGGALQGTRGGRYSTNSILGCQICFHNYIIIAKKCRVIDIRNLLRYGRYNVGYYSYLYVRTCCRPRSEYGFYGDGSSHGSICDVHTHFLS